MAPWCCGWPCICWGVGPGDEVLSPLSFVATANAVPHFGVVLHFVYLDPTTLAMDPASLAEPLALVAVWCKGQALNKQTGRWLAACCRCMFGHPADVEALRQVADT